MSNTTRFSLAAAIAAAAVGVLMPLSATGSGDARPPTPAPRAATGKDDEQPKPLVKQVIVNDNFFDARSLVLPSGGRVLWVWKGANRHNVTFTKVPERANRRGSATKRHGHWRRAFYKPGLYKYVCTLFTGMRGSIDVRAPQPEPSPPR